MDPGTILVLLPPLKAFGTMFGTYGLWRLAGGVRTARGSRRAAAWGWFWGGVGLAVGLFSFVAHHRDPSLGPLAVASSLVIHAPWIGFLLLRIRAPRVVSGV